jgi:cytochrome c biogenesis protein ResB
MIPRAARDPWRVVWRASTGAGPLTALLLALAAALAVSGWLPQMPAGQTVAYAEWRSEVQARFGAAATAMQALGLFTVSQSLGFRLLISLLAGCLLLRLADLVGAFRQGRDPAQPSGAWHTVPGRSVTDIVEQLHLSRYRLLRQPSLLQADRWPWMEVWPLLAHLGALMLLAGLLVAHLVGWQVEQLIVRSGETVSLPGTNDWVALAEETGELTHSSGIVAHVERRGPTVLASAADSAGLTLKLQQSAGSESVDELVLALTEDQFFAVPEADLVVRLAAQPAEGDEASWPILAQLYLSPPGELTSESLVADQADLRVGDTTLSLTRASYASVTATFNPGWSVAAVGVCFLLIGSVGAALRRKRRLWIREAGPGVQIAGLPPSALAELKGM